MTLVPEAALVAAVAVLAVANLLNNRLAVPAYLVTSLAATSLLLALLRLAGLTWADAGLGRDALGGGARSGLLLGAVVAVCCLAGALLPATRGGFLDRRVEHAGAGTVAYQVLLRIPLGTVLLEEVAFRGVVYGLVWRLHGTAWAVAVSCALFGLWHVLPSLDLARLNRAAGRAFDAHPARFVVSAVVASALAGAVLCELRRRTGSLVPTLMLHGATNTLSYLTMLLVTRWSRDGRGVGARLTSAGR